MKMVAEYLEHAIQFEKMAAEAIEPTLLRIRPRRVDGQIIVLVGCCAIGCTGTVHEAR